MARRWFRFSRPGVAKTGLKLASFQPDSALRTSFSWDDNDLQMKYSSVSICLDGLAVMRRFE